MFSDLICIEVSSTCAVVDIRLNLAVPVFIIDKLNFNHFGLMFHRRADCPEGRDMWRYGYTGPRGERPDDTLARLSL
ncbi:hypothetical protein J6590_015151 [Homalodisca vitripennis]|nr:hypothetical protein J6590_015151 [Homalodisca vitripennis]